MPGEEKPTVVIEEEKPDLSQEPVEIAPSVPPKVSEEDQLATKIKDDFEKLYGSRIKQIEDRLHGAYRIQEKLQKENEELKTHITKPAEKVSADPWTGIENGQVWKQEIERLAEEKAKAILQSRDAERVAQDAMTQQRTTLDGSKRHVIAKYPDLDPETGNTDSSVSKVYTTVLAEHPDYLTNPYGPLLAMYAMEEKLIEQQTPSGASAESARRSRANASSVPASRTGPSSGTKLTLTREQKAFCDRHNIKYEDFVKTATALEGNVEGIAA